MSREYYRLRCVDERQQEPVEVIPEPIKPKPRKKKPTATVPLTYEERQAKTKLMLDARAANELHYVETRLYIVGLTKSLIKDGHQGEGFANFGSHRWNTLDKVANTNAHSRWNDEHRDMSPSDACSKVFGHKLPSTLAAERIAQRKIDEGMDYDVHKYPKLSDYLRYGKHTYSH